MAKLTTAEMIEAIKVFISIRIKTELVKACEKQLYLYTL